VKLSVVILNWNRARDTIACVRSVEGWSRLKPEIHVVDNASGDGGADMIRRDCPSIRLTRNVANLGFAGGNNAAIREILSEKRAEAVLLLNNDAHLSERDAEILLHTLESHPRIGIVGPTILESDGKSSRLSDGGRNIAWHVHSRSWSADSTPTNKLVEVDYVSGAVALVRAAVFQKTGLFDEAYFFSGEMADFCTRAKSTGDPCAVCLAACAEHQIHVASPLRDTLYVYYNLRNRFLYVRKFYPRLKTALIPGWMLCGFLMGILAASQGKFGKARAVGVALRDGLAGRFGKCNERFTAQG
jgi:GT2 family glycosyltransferase